jgi:hypothetical protein
MTAFPTVVYSKDQAKRTQVEESIRSIPALAKKPSGFQLLTRKCSRKSELKHETAPNTELTEKSTGRFQRSGVGFECPIIQKSNKHQHDDRHVKEFRPVLHVVLWFERKEGNEEEQQ